jgi:hypothetical protein
MTVRQDGARHDAAWIAAWTLAGIALRLVLIGFTNKITGDGVGWYIPLARAFFEGRWADGFDAFIPPVYSLSVAFVAKLLPASAWTGPVADAGAMELAGQIASAAYGAATLPLVYLLVRRLAPVSHAVPAARIAVALAAIAPYLARYSAQVMSESTYTFFFVLASLAGLALLRRRSIATAAGFGLAVGVACLNRPEAMGLLIVIGGWVGLPAIVRPAKLPRALGLGAIVAIFFVAGLSPQIAATHARTGAWTLSAKGGQIFKSSHLKDPLARERWLYPAPRPKRAGAGEEEEEAQSFDAVAYVRSNPGTFLRHYVGTLALLLKNIQPALGVALLLLALAGTIRRRVIPRGEGERVAASLVITYLLLLSLFYGSARFLLPLVPFGLLWSSLGVLEVAGRIRAIGAGWTRLPARVRRDPLTWTFGAVLIFSLIEASGPAYDHGWRWYWSPEKRAGAWMRANLPPQPKIMTRSSMIETYYAGARVAYFPFAPYEEVIRYLQRTEVRYVLFDESKTSRLRPGFVGRFRASDARLVREFDLGRKRIYLYEVGLEGEGAATRRAREKPAPG